MGAHERQQLVLPRCPFGTGFGKAGRDDAQRLDTGCEHVARRCENRPTGHTDHGQIDGDRQLHHRRVACNAPDRLAGTVDRIDRAGEVRREHVPEELPADRPATRRGPDHGDGDRREERLQRRGDGHVVSLVGDRLRPGRDAEHDLDHTVLQRAAALEAGVVEDAEHRAVLRQHLGNELGEPGRGGVRRQPLEQPSADPTAMQIIGDGERDLRAARIMKLNIGGERDRT